MLGPAKPRRLHEPIAVSLGASFPRTTSTVTSRRSSTCPSSVSGRGGGTPK